MVTGSWLTHETSQDHRLIVAPDTHHPSSLAQTPEGFPRIWRDFAPAGFRSNAQCSEWFRREERCLTSTSPHPRDLAPRNPDASPLSSQGHGVDHRPAHARRSRDRAPSVYLPPATIPWPATPTEEDSSRHPSGNRVARPRCLRPPPRHGPAQTSRTGSRFRSALQRQSFADGDYLDGLCAGLRCRVAMPHHGRNCSYSTS